MNRKLFLLTFWLLFAAAGTVRAQSLAAFRERLAHSLTPGAPSEGRVVVTEAGDAAAAVARLASRPAPTRLRGYRVCIFFDNGQDARAGATAASNLFREHFPDVKLYMDYENPYFRVTVGNCLTIEEAIILKGRLSELFPKAFPKSVELLVADLLE